MPIHVSQHIQFSSATWTPSACHWPNPLPPIESHPSLYLIYTKIKGGSEGIIRENGEEQENGASLLKREGGERGV